MLHWTSKEIYQCANAKKKRKYIFPLTSTHLMLNNQFYMLSCTPSVCWSFCTSTKVCTKQTEKRFKKTTPVLNAHSLGYCTIRVPRRTAKDVFTLLLVWILKFSPKTRKLSKWAGMLPKCIFKTHLPFKGECSPVYSNILCCDHSWHNPGGTIALFSQFPYPG